MSYHDDDGVLIRALAVALEKLGGTVEWPMDEAGSSYELTLKLDYVNRQIVVGLEAVCPQCGCPVHESGFCPGCKECVA